MFQWYHLTMIKSVSRLARVLVSDLGEVVVGMLHAEQAQQPSRTTDDPVDHVGWRVWAYIALVTVAAAGCFLYLAPDFSGTDLQGFVTLTILAVVFERVGIRIYGATHVSAGVVALLAISIVYGASGAAIAAPVVVLAATAFTRSRWYVRLFDISSYTLVNVTAALVFHALIDVEAELSGWWVPAAMVAIVVNYAMNGPLVGIAVSLSTGEPWLDVWREKYQWIFPYYIVFGLLGVALVAAHVALGVPGIMAFVAPPLMMRFALHQYVTKTEQTVLELKQKNADLEAANHDITQMAHQLTEAYSGTLEALVLALDARDRETKGHSLRVSSYVQAIARELGLEEESQQWLDIQRGALLHDVGKIGVSDYILHKPGPLTPGEWDDMKRHPHIGYAMLKEISFLSGAADIVHAHHERFDGKGYPRGLMGDEMPLGARIFAVADTFDAMTSDRPYRKAVPPQVAWQEILSHSGTQFDPRVVQAFLAVYDELAQEKQAIDGEEKLRAA